MIKFDKYTGGSTMISRKKIILSLLIAGTIIIIISPSQWRKEITKLPAAFFSCSMKSRSWWNEGEIGVMADSSEWKLIETEMRNVYEHVIRTPEVEKTFTLKHISMNDFDWYTRSKYLIIVSTLNSTGKIGNIIKHQVKDPEIRAGVIKGEYYAFPLKDQWAKNQLILVLVAKDINSLKKKIIANGNFIYNIFKSDYLDYLKSTIEGSRGNKELEKELVDKYDWSILPQLDYFKVQSFPEKGFIWFRRLFPERWIFVRWIDGGDMSMLRPEWIIKERNRIGAEYYGGDSVVNKYLFSRQAIFLDRNAQITTGLWENNGKIKGGPFKNYTFYDPISRRVYMIDLALYAPGKDKLPYLYRMDVIAKSFRTIFDMNMEDE